jgi:lysozyme
MYQIVVPDRNWPIAAAAVYLIADKERGPSGGPALKAYLCPAKVWTYGWGEIDGVVEGMTCTETQSWDMLLRDLESRTVAVKNLLTVHTNENELGALVSLAYNIGLYNFQTSSVLRLHNKGAKAAAASAFLNFNKAHVNGVLTVLNGLTARRTKEAALYLTPMEDAVAEPSPQIVAPEQSPVSSQRVQTGVSVGVLGALGALSEAKDTLGPVSESISALRGFAADTLGIPTQYVPFALLVAVGVFLCWHFFKQRKLGIA